MNTLIYATDFNLWAQQTAELVRKQQWQEIDLEHLVEELEAVSKREKRAIASQLIRLLLHLLKWHYQPQRRSDSWIDSITDARIQIELTVQESPSLKQHPAEEFSRCYQHARLSAAKQTGLPLVTFPESCPYLLENVLSEAWLPE